MTINKPQRIFFFLSLFIAILSGCSKKSGMKGLGKLYLENISELEVAAVYRVLENQAVVTDNPDTSIPIFYYNSLDDMLSALDSDEISAATLYDSVSNYLVNQDSRYVIFETGRFTNSFSFALRDDESQLLNQINIALSDMKADGTLDELIQSYIYQASSRKDPPSITMPQIPGGKRVKVGFTGDLPPLDQILSDGSPAGFNTALLAEISRRAEINFDLVSVSCNVRCEKLLSHEIDLVFWVRNAGTENTMDLGMRNVLKGRHLDMCSGVVASEPYFSDDISLMGINRGKK